MTEKPALIFGKISAIMEGMDAVPKSKDMTEGARYKYRSIDQIKNASNVQFAKHKVFYSPKVLEHAMKPYDSKYGTKMIHHTIKVLYTLYAEDGSKVECEVYGEAADSGDKGLGKAQTYAEKVMLIQILNIPTEEQKDPDDENPLLKKDEKPDPKPPAKPIEKKKPVPPAAKTKEDPRIITTAQLTRLMTIATNTGWKDQEVKDFLKNKGYKSRKDILKKDYDAIINQIQNPEPAPDPVTGLTPQEDEEIPF